MEASARQASALDAELKLPESSLSAAELAYRRPSQATINLEVPPGVLVSEQALADQIGVGRDSLRPAPRRLSDTGPVPVLPLRGI